MQEISPFKKAIQKVLPEIIKIRRTIHANPIHNSFTLLDIIFKSASLAKYCCQNHHRENT